MHVAIYKGRKQIYWQDNPSSFALVGWMGYLDGARVTDLVIATPTVQLNLARLPKMVTSPFSEAPGGYSVKPILVPVEM